MLGAPGTMVFSSPRQHSGNRFDTWKGLYKIDTIPAMPVCMFQMLVVKALQTLGPSDNAAACTIIANLYAVIANATP